LDNVAKFRALLPPELAQEISAAEGTAPQQQRDPEVGFSVLST
jgi:hypothetical protein